MRGALPVLIRLTTAACERIVALARQDSRPGAGLRITLEPGGCCGLFYHMSIDLPQPQDAVVAVDDVRVFLSQ